MQNLNWKLLQTGRQYVSFVMWSVLLSLYQLGSQESTPKISPEMDYKSLRDNYNTL